MINETLTLVLPLVDSSKSGFVQTLSTLVLRQPVAANEYCFVRFLFYRARSLGETDGVPLWIYYCALYRNMVHPSGRKTNTLDTGGQPCTLVPIR